MPRDPFCSNCGYTLTGLTESSKCPECGKPLVEVLMREPLPFIGRRYKSKIMIFGLPLVHVALGPHDDGRRGIARGIIAIGDIAYGWFACGGAAFGFIALGGLAVGALAVGGGAIGLLALGGGAIGGAAVGGGALGGIAFGGGSVGYVAFGGGGLGYYAMGGGPRGVHVVSNFVRDPEAVRFFTEWSWLFGKLPPLFPPNAMSLATFPLWIALIGGGFALLLGLLVAAAYLKQRRAVALL